MELYKFARSWWSAASFDGSRFSVSSAYLSGVDQHVAVGMASERSAATRLKDGLSLSGVDRHVAIGMASERSAATRLKRVHHGAGLRRGRCVAQGAEVLGAGLIRDNRVRAGGCLLSLAAACPPPGTPSQHAALTQHTQAGMLSWGLGGRAPVHISCQANLPAASVLTRSASMLAL